MSTQLVSTNSQKLMAKAPVENALRRHAMLFVVSVFCVGGALVGQLQYPTHDDWSYGWSVKHLMETGELQYLACFATAMPLILSGAVASKLFGFSFALLHNVSAIYSILASCGMFLTIREWTKSTTLAAISASTILFNPILVNLSFAFMTDPPTMAFMSWSLWAAGRILRAPKQPVYVALLLTFMSLGTTTRQSFITMIPLLLTLGATLYKKTTKTSLILFACIPLQILLMVAADSYLLSQMHFPDDSLRIKYGTAKLLFNWLHHPDQFTMDAWTIFGKAMAYIGPFLFPILVWKLPQIVHYTNQDSKEDTAQLRRTISLSSLLVALLTVTVPITYLSCFTGQWMPYFPPFWDFPKTGYYICLSHPLVRSTMITQYWTFACSLLGTLLVWTTAFSSMNVFLLTRHTKDKSRQAFVIGLLLCTSLMLICTIVQGKTLNYDRYLIPLLIPFILLNCMDQCNEYSSNSQESLSLGTAEKDAPMSSKERAGTKRAALLSVLFLAVYSFVALLDSVHFHSARWKAALHMESKGIKVDELDVGPDYLFSRLPEAYRFYNPHTSLFSFRRNDMTGEPPRGAIRGWPILNEKYVLNPEFNPYIFDYFRPVYRQPYWSPWTWGEQQILVMMKDERESQRTGVKQWLPPKDYGLTLCGSQ